MMKKTGGRKSRWTVPLTVTDVPLTVTDVPLTVTDVPFDPEWSLTMLL